MDEIEAVDVESTSIWTEIRLGSSFPSMVFRGSGAFILEPWVFFFNPPLDLDVASEEGRDLG